MVRVMKSANLNDCLSATDWQKYRPVQGYAYRQVLAEINRRRKGEYTLTEHEARDAHQVGVMKSAQRFQFAALFSNLLRSLELTEDSLIELVGCVKGDEADTLLASMINPVPKQGGVPITHNDFMDELYPGQKLKQVNK